MVGTFEADDLSKAVRLATQKVLEKQRRAENAQRTFTRDELLDHIIEQSAASNIALSPAEANQVAERIYQERNLFTPPSEATQLIGRAYIARRAITRTVLAATAIAAVAFGTIKTGQAIYKSSQEANVERLADETAGNFVNLRSEALRIQENDITERMPEQEAQQARRLEQDLLARTEEGLEYLDEHFQPTIQEAVTADNYQLKQEQLLVIEEKIPQVVELRGELRELQQEQLDYERLQDYQLPIQHPALTSRASQLEVRLEQALNQRDIDAALRAESTLVELYTREQKIQNLQNEFSAQYQRLMQAGDQQLREAIQEEEKAFQTAYRQADVEAAQGQVDALGEAASQLSLSYQTRIVGGKWRQYKDEEGRRGDPNYYLIVEARDERGRKVRIPIDNEETPEIETKPIWQWGERVPEEIYRRYEEDKKADGIIDEQPDIYCEKQPGTITAECRYERVGQITRW